MYINTLLDKEELINLISTDIKSQERREPKRKENKRHGPEIFIIPVTDCTVLLTSWSHIVTSNIFKVL